MKRLTLLMQLLFSLSMMCIAQEKKPTLMILPSDSWCSQRFFMTSYDNQGMTVYTPNYQQAFTEDPELGQVVSKIGGLLTAKGYSIKDAEMETKAVYARMSEDNVLTSKGGSSIAESPLDIIKRRAKMDVIIQLDWTVNMESAGRSVSFTLEAFDAYTSKRIATSSGTGKPSGGGITNLLEKAVASSIKEFDKQLTAWYNKTRKEGREIVLTVRVWNSWENDLESEYDGDELIDCIRKWIKKNTVGGAYNLSDATEDFAQFEQVHIPLIDEDGDGLDARGFATRLRKYLNSAYSITSKVMTRGLGEAIIVLGEK